MSFYFLITTFLLFSFANSSSVKSGCSVSVNGDLLEPQPLLLKLKDGEDSNQAFYLPDETDGTIYFSVGQQIKLACPDGDVLLDGTSLGVTTQLITCVSGKSFSLGGSTVDFSTISCSKYPLHSAAYTGGTCLGGRGKEIQIGFDVDGYFIKHIMSCFDDSAQDVLYTEFNLTKTIQGYQIGFPRPSWVQGSFYSTPTAVNTLYTRATQRVTINSLLGLEANDTTYVHATDNYYLTRGHLVAKTDFVYGGQHRLTFYFVNAAPQFQTFNCGNWYTLEANVRSFAADNQLDLVIYTGTHGVTTLPDVNGVQQELYLYVDENNNKAISVPRVFWKVLYEPISKKSIGFVGVNNPYRLDEKKDILCTDICSQVSWITWKQTDLQSGYSYCCEVTELKKAISNIPELDASGVLL